MKNFEDELNHIQTLIDKVNEGNSAFWEIIRNYKSVVRTELGHDSNLTYYESDIRNALGNDLELAIGKKNV